MVLVPRRESNPESLQSTPITGLAVAPERRSNKNGSLSARMIRESDSRVRELSSCQAATYWTIRLDLHHAGAVVLNGPCRWSDWTKRLRRGMGAAVRSIARSGSNDLVTSVMVLELWPTWLEPSNHRAAVPTTAAVTRRASSAITADSW